MGITIDIEKIARTSRLNLSEEEKREFKNDLEEILRSFEIISKIDTTNVEPTFRPIRIYNVYRDDKIRESMNRIELMKDIVNKEDFYYKGPKTQEE